MGSTVSSEARRETGQAEGVRQGGAAKNSGVKGGRIKGTKAQGACVKRRAALLARKETGQGREGEDGSRVW